MGQGSHTKQTKHGQCMDSCYPCDELDKKRRLASVGSKHKSISTLFVRHHDTSTRMRVPFGLDLCFRFSEAVVAVVVAGEVVLCTLVQWGAFYQHL